jgi:dipeptidyl aminopeptidase/acylaminoacyl peptidase
LQDISGPVQLHHSTTDEEVPALFAEKLHQQMKLAGKTSELYLYPGDNHNISGNFGAAMFRSVQFMDKYVKNAKP